MPTKPDRPRCEVNDAVRAIVSPMFPFDSDVNVAQPVRQTSEQFTGIKRRRNLTNSRCKKRPSFQKASSRSGRTFRG